MDRSINKTVCHSKTFNVSSNRRIRIVLGLTWRQVASRPARATHSRPPCRSDPSRSSPFQMSASSAISEVKQGHGKSTESQLLRDYVAPHSTMTHCTWLYLSSTSCWIGFILWMSYRGGETKTTTKMNLVNESCTKWGTCSSMSLMINNDEDINSHFVFASSKLCSSLEKW